MDTSILQSIYSLSRRQSAPEMYTFSTSRNACQSAYISPWETGMPVLTTQSCRPSSSEQKNYRPFIKAKGIAMVFQITPGNHFVQR